MGDWDPEDLIATERAINRGRLDLLRMRGIETDAEGTLGFVYMAEQPSDAQRLAQFLRAETDYDVETTDDGVTGSTKPMPVTPEALDEWLAWMIQAGYDYGRCRFQGWSTSGVFSGPLSVPANAGAAVNAL